MVVSYGEHRPCNLYCIHNCLKGNFYLAVVMGKIHCPPGDLARPGPPDSGTSGGQLLKYNPESSITGEAGH